MLIFLILKVNNMRNYKEDFPVFLSHPNLVYLDSAASSLKCKRVIDKLNSYYNNNGVNVHRGVYSLSYEATDMYEGAREIIAKCINNYVDKFCK